MSQFLTEAPVQPPVTGQSTVEKSTVDSCLCSHCGTACDSRAIPEQDQIFCCQGCQAVYHLLQQNGLSDYYSIDDDARIPIPRRDRDHSFEYLDKPETRAQLIDYNDGQTARIRLHIPAIHCAACVWLLEHLYQINPNIGESRVNLLTKELSISFDEQALQLSGLIEQLHALGYPPDLQLNQLKEDSKPSKQLSRLTLQIGVAGFCFGNIMLLSFPHYLGLTESSGQEIDTLTSYLPPLLTLPILLFSASDYWSGALRNLKHRYISIEVPIVMGLVALFVESTYQTFGAGAPGYWDSLAGLVFFLLCGKAFKQRTLDHLSFDRDFRAFFPLSVLRYQEGVLESVAISEIKEGDQLRIRNQELIPTDAILTSEKGAIDYSFVTGEADPVQLKKGATVYAGGKNLGPTIKLNTSKPISESYLTSLWNHHVFQEDSEREFRNLTDHFSQYFTLSILLIAFSSAFYWWFNDPSQSLRTFASVLIVACPCALALAAPFASGTALRMLTGASIHLKNTRVIEQLARISTIVFDKTGTLTHTKARSTKFEGRPLSPAERKSVACIARHSAHPLSITLHQHLDDEQEWGTASNYQEVEGKGVRGEIDSTPIIYGSPSWLRECGISGLANDADPRAGIYLAINGLFRGCFRITPRYRRGIRELMTLLAAKYDLKLASGDSDRDQNTIRAYFGKKAELSFNQNPYSKLQLIEKLQSDMAQVMFVGDGLNDAGALRQANVGIAITEDTSHFSPASDVIISARSLGYLPQLLQYSKATVSIIKISFALSLAYNLVGITLAASGRLTPLLAAILMPLSSVTIIAFSTSATAWVAKRLNLPIDQGHDTENQ